MTFGGRIKKYLLFLFSVIAAPFLVAQNTVAPLGQNQVDQFRLAQKQFENNRDPLLPDRFKKKRPEYIIGKSIPNQSESRRPLHNKTGNIDTAWVRHYGPDFISPFNQVSALALDDSGYIYITGSFYEETTSSDFLTIKYNSLGDIVWMRRYNHPYNDYDQPTFLAIDRKGNVYVTGSGRYGDNFGDAEIVVIKYTSNGDMLWSKRGFLEGHTYNKGGLIALDRIGNVYISSGENNYGTVKLNSDGDLVWTRFYNGPGNSYDAVGAMAIDSTGNVYVTGTSYGSSEKVEYATIKYNEYGDSVWVRRISGPQSFLDVTSSIAVDKTGYVYITCSPYDNLHKSDYLTIKYTSDGDTVWTRRYNGPGNGYDISQFIKVDKGGNVYVTGSSGIIKYAADGTQLWIDEQNGIDIELDANGNVFTTGYDTTGILTAKINSAGESEWISHYSYAQGTSNRPAGIRIDSIGNIYVAGTTLVPANEQTIFTLIKYIQTPTSVSHASSIIPSQCALSQNYPNPFNPSTTIRYALPSSAHVKLSIYNILGQVVSELVDEQQSAGWKEVTWNASAMSSGIYYYELRANNYVAMKKMMMLK